MGHQQKLLFVTSLLVIGVGIIIGIHKYHSAEAEANVNALMIDVMHIASRAQAYYFTPRYLNGGGRSFAGIGKDKVCFNRLFEASRTENGTFRILPSSNDQTLIFQAIGNHDIDEDGQNFTVRVKVFPDSTQTFVINH